MNFLALNDDVKFIISKYLASDLKIRTLFSKNHDLQKILFGDIVFDDDLCKYFKLMYDYVRMYVCIYVCTYVYIHTYTYIRIFVYIHKYINIRIHS
jgi:hypothetical protein